MCSQQRIGQLLHARTTFGVVAWASLSVSVALAQATQHQTSELSGLDFFSSAAKLARVGVEYRTVPGNTRDVTTQTVNLRYDYAFYLTPTWTIVSRSDLPLLARKTINSANPNGSYLYGVGDADIQAAVIHDLDKRWVRSVSALVSSERRGPLGLRQMAGDANRWLPGCAAGDQFIELS